MVNYIYHSKWYMTIIQYIIVQVRADIKGTLLEKNNHKLEGNAKYEQSFGARAGPATVGAGLRYSNDKAHLGLNAQHTRGYGTDVSIFKIIFIFT